MFTSWLNELNPSELLLTEVPQPQLEMSGYDVMSAGAEHGAPWWPGHPKLQVLGPIPPLPEVLVKENEFSLRRRGDCFQNVCFNFQSDSWTDFKRWFVVDVNTDCFVSCLRPKNNNNKATIIADTI